MFDVIEVHWEDMLIETPETWNERRSLGWKED